MRHFPYICLLLALALLAAGCADATAPPENAISPETTKALGSSQTTTTTFPRAPAPEPAEPATTTTSTPPPDEAELLSAREFEEFFAVSHAAQPDPKAVAVGSSHSCALHDDGTVSCWGSNEHGELGNDLTRDHADSSELVRVLDITDAIEITASSRHTCAIHQSGLVSCWGANDFGQIASEQPDYSATPIQVDDITDAAAVTAGDTHTCALRQDSTISCWGNNENGQLGSGQTFQSSAAPVQVWGIADATAVTAGDSHACAIRQTGAISCWGANDSGQLGNGRSGDITDSFIPVPVADITDATAIAAGSNHTCALHQSGSISCWGDNKNWQLASGSVVEASDVPTPVLGISDATAIAAGKERTCALQPTVISCWGEKDPIQITDEEDITGILLLPPLRQLSTAGLPPDVIDIAISINRTCALLPALDAFCWDSFYPIPPMLESSYDVISGDAAAIAAGDDHVCILHHDGAISCSGTNEYGQLGNGKAGNNLSSSVPVKVSGVSDAKLIAAGDRFTCALQETGLVSCWGDNEHGQLGNDRGDFSPIPITVEGIRGAIDIATGSSHACAIHGNYDISCWGANNFAQLGIDQSQEYSATPVRVRDIDTALFLDAGENHTCTVHQDFTVACWGANDFGQLGNGQTGGVSTTLVYPDVASNPVGIAAGNRHTCVIIEPEPLTQTIPYRPIYCWGANDLDQLGRGEDGSSELQVGLTTALSSKEFSTVVPVQQDTSICDCEPAPVADIGDAMDISAGSNHTCALRVDRTVSCWGANELGQLGNGSTGIFRSESSPMPQQTAGISDADRIAAGGDNSCALHLTGAVSCWGNNNEGQLGNGQIASASTASQKVADINDATSVAAGTSFTCALRQNASISCWGKNSSGELGIGQTTYEIASSQVPVEVDGITDARAVDLGWSHACALHSDGSISCWGENEDGQLGNSQTAQSHMPLEVEGISDAVSVSTGPFHTCAVRQNGSISCWGLNSIGQLGNGLTDDSGPSQAPVGGTAVHKSASLRSVQLSRFTSVIGIADASSVAAGGGHTCALHQNGIVSCWGNNESGQLGNGRSRLGWNALAQFSAVPVQVEGITDAIAVDAGAGFSCALHETGSVSCWGDNEFGELGNGQMEDDSPVPVPVEGIDDATAIATGGTHACAIHQNGAVSCWGNNSLLQRGTNQTILPSAIPVSVSGISDAAAVSAGAAHTCILHQDGTITCLGINLLGELGNSQGDYSVVPVKVVGFGE